MTRPRFEAAQFETIYGIEWVVLDHETKKVYGFGYEDEASALAIVSDFTDGTDTPRRFVGNYTKHYDEILEHNAK